MTLPPRREAGSTYRVSMVCLGNICRSPVAAVVLAEKLDAAGLSDRVSVRSAGTGDWHIGDPMDRRAAASLVASGYDPSAHRAQQFDATWLADDDLVLAMDASNYRDVAASARDEQARSRVRMFREFDPLADDDLDVPDPWYGGPGGFQEVLAIVERTTDALIAELSQVD